MRPLTLSALSTVSFGALAFGLSSPSLAQVQPVEPVTPSEVQECNRLPTPQERQLCIAGQARPDDTVQEAGELGTLPPSEAIQEQAASGDAIVVTGSRIRRSPFNSPDPITVINPELEERGGSVETAEILQSSPVAAGSFQITSVISAGNYVTNGGTGAQTLSLRGLGAERTLVLVNGRRAGPAGTRGSIAGFDLNVMPSSLIQTVDILKTGASSIYGSDAIAGVVNLQTKRSTDGIELRGFASAPFEGGAENYNLSGAYGKEFSRGHFLVGADYTRRNDLKRRDRSYLGCPEEYLFSEADGSRLDVRDPRTGDPRCAGAIENQILLTTVFGTGSPNNPQNLVSTTIQFNNPGDRLDEFVPGVPVDAGNPRDFGAPEGFYFVNASNADSIGVVNAYSPAQAAADVIPELERYTLWADGSFEIAPGIELVGELLYNNRKTHSDGWRQLFFYQFPGETNAALTNAYCDPSVNNCVPGDAGDPLNEGFSGWLIFRPVVGVSTFQKTEVDYYRAVGGVRGDFGGTGGFLDTWGWDSYVQYSRSDGDYTNHRIFQDAIDTQEWRTRRCEGTMTAIRGVPCMDIDWTDPRVLSGNFTPEERAFLFGQETGNTLYEQLTAEASVSGSLFTLPAGDIGLALGVQWRRDEIDDTPGEITQAGNVWGQSVAGRTAGFARTTEAFGEVEVPLIHNTPFIERLTLSGAARVTNVYAERHDGESHSSNNNWTYKAGFNWQTNDWLRFRGTYGTSYRSPALFEQFLADQTGFLGQANIDPCIRWGENLDPAQPLSRLQERCQALGIDPNYGGAGSSALIISGGGVGVLEPETSTAKTVSVIFTPDRGLWDGNRFSVAVDYFDIDVEGEIAQLGAANIIAQCMTSDDYPNDPLCSLFTRAAEGSAQFPNILEVSDSYININRQRNRGIDVTTRMTQDLGRFGTFGALAQMTWQIEDFVELFEGTQVSDEGESSEPTWIGDFKFTWDNGPWSLFWGTNVVGGTSDEQDLRDARGGDVCIPSTIRGGTFCPVYRLDPQFYHSASVTRDVAEGRFSMTLGVSNIFDTAPPPVSASFGPISTIGNAPIFGTQYDFLGRRAFISVRTKL